tara:strand:+ start:851 stop:1009 length:159 start_codon:yes stop_codon:yes gene_type:complete
MTETLGYVMFLLISWFVIGSAAAFIVATVFFGSGVKEISEEEYRELSERRRD